MIYQKGTSWDELSEEIKDYIIENASDESPISLDAEHIEEIADKLVKECGNGK